ncbi:hypothetical protein V6N13_079812 [Hibiscus sabdariffa]
MCLAHVRERVAAGRQSFGQVISMRFSRFHFQIGYRLACHRKTGSAMAMLFGSLGFPCFVGSFGNDAAMRFLAGYFVGRCVGAICYPLCAADLRISRQQNSSIRC